VVLDRTQFPEKPPALQGGFFYSASGPDKHLELAVSHNTDDLRIREIKELSPPAHVMRELVCTPEISANVYDTRNAIHKILTGEDDRLLVIIGPCSIHNPVAAMDYARHLVVQRERFADDLVIVMRVYFEKPRTTVGWKGLINDPALDGSFNINQ